MSDDRIEGAVRTLGGEFEKGLGDVTGDRKLQADGIVDQVAGTAQNVVGGAKDVFRSALDQAPPGVRDSADRAIAAARKSPFLATLAVGAFGIILAKIVRDTANSGRRARRP